MLSEWAVMLDAHGLLVNYYGAGTVGLRLPTGEPVTLHQDTDYPAAGAVALRVEPGAPSEFDLRLRIPGWSRQTQVSVNGEPVKRVEAGTYLSLDRRWSPGDRVDLAFDMAMRIEPGEGPRRNRMCLFRGPLLLAYDQHYNRQDRQGPPTLDPAGLKPTVLPLPDEMLPPWVLVEVGSEDDRVTLCDFAGAGAYGTTYWSWLPAVAAAPGPFYLGRPVEGDRVAPGPMLLEWGGLGSPRPVPHEQSVTLSRRADLREPVLEMQTEFAYAVADLAPGTYYWQVTRTNASGERTNEGGPQSFVVDPEVQPRTLDLPETLQVDEDGVVVASALDGDGTPAFGELLEARNVTPAEDRHGNPSGAAAFNGEDSKISYRLAYFPSDDYSAMCWFYLESYPREQYGQVVSAWCPGEDPLRITIEGQELFARIEGFGTGGTPRVKVDLGRWIHVAAVKQGVELTLYVDGVPMGSTAAPEEVLSRSTEIAIGANPLYPGHEYLHGRIDDFRFYARALTADEVRQAFEGSGC